MQRRSRTVEFDHDTEALSLDDGTVWIVEPEGFTWAILWELGQQVTVEPLEDEWTTVEIRNLDLDEAVYAVPPGS